MFHNVKRGYDMEKTWKPTAAGIINIISGAISVSGVIWLVIAITAVETWTLFLNIIPAEEFPFAAPLVSTILIILLVLSIIEAVLPIVGGVFALQRRKWGWALAGSIIAILGTFPLGVAATIFVSLAKDEFK